MKKYKSTHPCQMSQSSINQYLQLISKNEEYIAWIHEAFDYINKISALVISHPKSAIKKSRFYILKSAFIYFVYTICTPHDKQNADKRFIVKPVDYAVNPYGTIYTLEFIIDGISHMVTTMHNPTLFYSSNYLEEFFKGFIPPKDPVVFEHNDYSYMSDLDVYKEYCNFIKWCTQHEWFFTIFYDDIATFNILTKLYKDSIYAIHYDNNQPSIFKIFRQPKFFGYIINPETMEVIVCTDHVKNIRNIFTDPNKTRINFDDVIKSQSITDNRKSSVYYYPNMIAQTLYKDKYKQTEYKNLPYNIAKVFMNVINFINVYNDNKDRVCIQTEYQMK